MRKLWQTRNVKTAGGINRRNRVRKWGRGYSKCVHVPTRERKGQKIGHRVFLYKMETITVSLKDIPESLILKIHNIVGIYASKFFVVNIEHCSPITMFMKGKALRFLLCFSGFMLKLGLHYLFLIWAIWFVCIMVHTMHIPMFSLLAFQRIFIVFCLLVNCKQTYLFDCWLILCKYFLQLNALN